MISLLNDLISGTAAQRTSSMLRKASSISRVLLGPLDSARQMPPLPRRRGRARSRRRTGQPPAKHAGTGPKWMPYCWKARWLRRRCAVDRVWWLRSTPAPAAPRVLRVVYVFVLRVGVKRMIHLKPLCKLLLNAGFMRNRNWGRKRGRAFWESLQADSLHYHQVVDGCITSGSTC